MKFTEKTIKALVIFLVLVSFCIGFAFTLDSHYNDNSIVTATIFITLMFLFSEYKTIIIAFKKIRHSL